MSEINITHDLLVLLAERSSYDVSADGLVFFGFRGLLPLDVTGTDFAAGHRARLVSFDHERMRCTLGQWRPAQGDLALFPGSTVPNLKAMRTAKAVGGVGANMLMLGRYAYDLGVHKAGKPTGHRAFRQGMFFPVWRNSDDLDFDLVDRLDTSGKSPEAYPWDNLHCAYHDDVDTPTFSSNGCQVVSGRPSMPANNNRPESGPWARFVANAYGPAASGQRRFPYLLFSGTEAGLVAAKPAGPFNRSVRFGSRGEWVEKVQTALRAKDFPFLDVDAGFGRDTLEAVMAFQAREFGIGQADGVVGPNTAAALGVEWPQLSISPSTTHVAPSTAPSVVPSAAPAALVSSPVSTASAGAPEEWRSAALRITAGFEVAGDPYAGVSGDFDGMGVSCGALQWNIGQNSLQPMVVAAGQAVVSAAMPQLGAEMWKACTSKIPAGLAIVRRWQTGDKLSATAKAELRALMVTPQMRAEQDRMVGKVADRALIAADRWAKGCGRAGPSKREFFWFFDLITQNGGLEAVTPASVTEFIDQNSDRGAADVICDFLANLSGTSGHIKDADRNAELWRGKAAGLSLELLVLSYLRSGSASPKWRHVVLNRKGAIAMGRGWVNSTQYDFTSDLA